jgi:hypothetical protein
VCERCDAFAFNPSAWRHLIPGQYCAVGGFSTWVFKFEPESAEHFKYVYRANEAEFILLHSCSIERGTNQSLHSDYANKLIDISKRDTTVSNRFSGLYYMS